MSRGVQTCVFVSPDERRSEICTLETSQNPRAIGTALFILAAQQAGFPQSPFLRGTVTLCDARCSVSAGQPRIHWPM